MIELGFLALVAWLIWTFPVIAVFLVLIAIAR